MAILVTMVVSEYLLHLSTIPMILRRLVCFPSNLHVKGFSSWWITYKIQFCLVWFLWWLRHGAIGPSEATPLWVSVDWLDVGIDIFNLVIRVSKVEQLAFLFSAFFEIPLLLPSSWPWPIPTLGTCSRSELPETVFSLQRSFWSDVPLKAPGMSLYFGFWWGWTCCAPNSTQFE